jgi:putative transposase
MPQSLSAVYLHIIFSTKERRPFLRDLALRGSMHGYLGAIAKEIDCQPIVVGGVADHVHLLVGLSRVKTQAELVKELKRNSTIWVKGESGRAGKFEELRDFQWQNGYAVFSVSQSNLAEVREYIEEQEEHHRERTFQGELVAFLNRHEEVYDERYLWD